MISNGMDGDVNGFGEESEADNVQFIRDLTLVMEELRPRIELFPTYQRLQLHDVTRSVVTRNWPEYRKQYLECSIRELRKFANDVFSIHKIVFLERCKELLAMLVRLKAHEPWPSFADVDAILTDTKSDLIKSVLTIMEHDSVAARRAIELMLRGMTHEQVCIECVLTGSQVRNLVVAFWERVDNEIHKLSETLSEDTGIAPNADRKSRRECMDDARWLVLCTTSELQGRFERAELIIEQDMLDADDQTYLRLTLSSIQQILIVDFSKQMMQLAKLISCLRQINRDVYRVISDRTG